MSSTQRLKTELQIAIDSSYDAVVVDIMLPRLDRFSVIDDLHQRPIKLPVLTLSAKRSVDESLEGLQAGGDDYRARNRKLNSFMLNMNVLKAG